MIVLAAILIAATAAPAAVSPALRAVAALQPTRGSAAHGTAAFERVEGGVRVVVQVSGLSPGAHGFHVHQTGDCSAPDASSAGGHFDPTSAPHAARESAERHVGDLGNLEADASGQASAEFIDRALALEGPCSILNRAVIVHEKRDDLKTQPTGDAGGRLACGVTRLEAPPTAR